MAAKTITLGETALALDLPNEQSFEDWLDLGRNLASANKVLQWWIGDWWAAGSHRYGERAKAAAEGIFGREFGTLMNLASVSRAFETSRRREHLSFAHHVEVASLDPVVADDLLERAERDGWTRNDIRAEAALLKPAVATARYPDPVEIEWSALRAAWQRARVSVRERFIAEMNGVEPLP